MWINGLILEQIKCIEELSIALGTDKERFKWVTLLGDNGTGKTTILQAIALVLSGSTPIGLAEFNEASDSDRIQQLLKQQESEYVLHQVAALIQLDRSELFEEEVKTNEKVEILSGLSRTNLYNWSHKLSHITTARTIDSSGKEILISTKNVQGNEDPDFDFTPMFDQPKGWFAAGYGTFRHISKKPTLSIPQVVEPKKRNNFLTLFEELESLGGFHQWLITLDYKRINPNEGISAQETKHYNMAIQTLNSLLPDNSKFHSVNSKGIWYMVNGNKVNASYLSDGFRNIIALIGDLIWRLVHAYPDSVNPLHETGIVLIDELAIHLHPKWQRQIAGDLQRTFPNLQFIVTTHSPLIAAGAGRDAVTYQLELDEAGKTQVEKIENIYAWSVDKILQSKAFDLKSPFSRETAATIEEYYQLMSIKEPSPKEEAQLEEIRPLVREALGEQANEEAR